MSPVENVAEQPAKVEETPKKGRRKSMKSTPEAKAENGEKEVPPAPADGPVNGTSEDAPKEEAKPKKETGSKKKKGKKDKKAAAAEGGEKADGEQATEPKKKPMKKKIPHWATLSDAQLAKIKPSELQKGGPTGVTAIINAINECADSKGIASYILIKKHIQKHHPNWPKMTFKTALRSSVAKGRVKQIRNSYKVINDAKIEKVKVEKKVSKSRSKTVTVKKDGPLEELFPHIFTWVCEPKEASYGLIRKYILKHFPNLSEVGLKKAVENMVKRGQLDQITGKGASGTFQLMDGASKAGNQYEDPIEDAIIASNLPKDCSVPALKHYLSEFHLEYNVKDKPKVLQSALERAEKMGWIVRISGKGMSGSFRLAHDYIPSPKDLWRGDYKESNYVAITGKKENKDEKKPASKKDEKKSSGKKRKVEYDSDSSLDEDEEEEEVIPKKKSRGAPSPRKEAVPKKKVKKSPAKPKPAKAKGETKTKAKKAKATKKGKKK